MSHYVIDPGPSPGPAMPTGALDVLLDVDGVLYPLPELFTPYAAEHLGRDLHLDTTNWAFYAEWGLGYDDFVDLLGRGVREGRIWWSGDPYDDVVDAVGRIHAAGHRIHVVTARDVEGIEEEAEAATAHWLDRHGLAAESVNLLQDKAAVVARLGLDPARCFGVDDGPHYIAAYNAVGVYGVVVDRWGGYRGEHPVAGDLAAVADLIAP